MNFAFKLKSNRLVFNIASNNSMHDQTTFAIFHFFNKSCADFFRSFFYDFSFFDTFLPKHCFFWVVYPGKYFVWFA